MPGNTQASDTETLSRSRCGYLGVPTHDIPGQLVLAVAGSLPLHACLPPADQVDIGPVVRSPTRSFAGTHKFHAIGVRMYVIEREQFERIFPALRERGYTLIAPTWHEGAIVYDEVRSAADLPRGMSDQQGPGAYTLTPSDDGMYFGVLHGAPSWKRFLYPPTAVLFTATRSGSGFTTDPEPAAERRYAFVGVRACELHAIRIQDRVFTGGEFVDPHYRSRRVGAFILAVNCTRAGATCFCTSMNTGPRVGTGADLVLTEMYTDGKHWFLADVGTDQGMTVLDEVGHRDATDKEMTLASTAVAGAAASMFRSVDTAGLQGLLDRGFEHPAWDNVARRCMTCANCTMVCPTCFCSTVEDTTDLLGATAKRVRRWDSCFTLDFARVAGGNFRTSARSRYRQWLTHKFSTWIDQFGEAGCVGCGRCITWCPVGIDITRELATLRNETSMPSDSQ